MGEHRITATDDEREVREFTRAVLADIRALEEMLERGMVESGAVRFGVEQEMFLVDESGRARPAVMEVLGNLDDHRFTTELARFNIEANLDPRPVTSAFLSELEQRLRDVVERVARAGADAGARPLLTGILPTLRHDDLTLENITPHDRFRRLNEVLLALRGGSFAVTIDGVEQLEAMHDSVMLESANTSLQLHLQVDPDRAGPLYNLAQLISAPLLAAAVNSPVLLGRRLWQETRVALFERSVDYRTASELERDSPSRVGFGDAWVEDTVLEVFRDNIARHRVIMTCDHEDDPLALVEEGNTPKLAALTLHNGTVWRWNRPCYGVSEGAAHFRIENRVLPAGPTVLDEVANAALFYGLMKGLEEQADTIPGRLSFADATINFQAAARQGLDAELTWLDGRHVSARRLLLDELVPAARRGLSALGARRADVQRYLGVIRARVMARRTGARWLMDCVSAAGGRDNMAAAVRAVQLTLERQLGDQAVHTWEPLHGDTHSADAGATGTVADIMSTRLFTVQPGDIVDLATSVMDWRHVRHVPVESRDGDLVGLLSMRALLRLWETVREGRDREPVVVEEIMDRDPPIVAPGCPLDEAMQRVLDTDYGCLLVVSGGRLRGIVTERDLVRAAVSGSAAAPRSG